MIIDLQRRYESLHEGDLLIDVDENSVYEIALIIRMDPLSVLRHNGTRLFVDHWEKERKRLISDDSWSYIITRDTQ